MGFRRPINPDWDQSSPYIGQQIPRKPSLGIPYCSSCQYDRSNRCPVSISLQQHAVSPITRRWTRRRVDSDYALAVCAEQKHQTLTARYTPLDNESIGFYSVTGEQSRQAPSGNLAFQGVTYAFRPAHYQQRAIASRNYSADFRIHQSAYEKQRTFGEKKRYKNPTSSNTAGLAMPLNVNASISDVDSSQRRHGPLTTSSAAVLGSPSRSPSCTT